MSWLNFDNFQISKTCTDSHGPFHNPKVQENYHLIHHSEVQHTGRHLGGLLIWALTDSSSLTWGNSSLEESPTHLGDFVSLFSETKLYGEGSLTISIQFNSKVALGSPSFGSFPATRLLFCALIARFVSWELERQGSCLGLPPNAQFTSPWWFFLQVVDLLDDRLMPPPIGVPPYRVHLILYFLIRVFVVTLSGPSLPQEAICNGPRENLPGAKCLSKHWF